MKAHCKAFRRADDGDLTDGALDYIEIVCAICEYSVHPSLEAVLPDRDEYDGHSFGWQGRGELIVINLWCENCGDSRRYRLLLGNHKGHCQLAFVPCWEIERDDPQNRKSS